MTHEKRTVRPLGWRVPVILSFALLLARCGVTLIPEVRPELIPHLTPEFTPEPTSTATAPAAATPPPSPQPFAVSQPEPAASPPALSPTPQPTLGPAPTTTPSTQSLDLPLLVPSPGDPVPYLETFLLVSYYGSPTGWGLGILGESERDAMTRDLQQAALQIQALSPGRFVIPTYHMVTTVADSIPGADENYRHQVELELIDDWVAAAESYGIACILDIQPGRADIQTEFDRIKYLLDSPHVHLALDPEFTVGEQQIPGASLGSLDAEQINAIQAQMDDIAVRIGVRRVLILHQFTDSMLPDKDQLDDYPYVELIIDADGVSTVSNKLHDYNQYVTEPGFEYAGIKVFTRHDTPPLLSPEQMMQLEPPPALVIYQ